MDWRVKCDVTACMLAMRLEKMSEVNFRKKEGKANESRFTRKSGTGDSRK
jgi:hypothetical protein